MVGRRERDDVVGKAMCCAHSGCCEPAAERQQDKPAIFRCARGAARGAKWVHRVRNGKGRRRLTVIVIRWDGDCCVFDTWCVVVLRTDTATKK